MKAALLKMQFFMLTLRNRGLTSIMGRKLKILNKAVFLTNV